MSFDRGTCLTNCVEPEWNILKIGIHLSTFYLLLDILMIKTPDLLSS